MGRLKIVRKTWWGICLVNVLACASAFAATQEAGKGRYWAADIHQQPLPGTRLTSGLTICDEALWMGRWVNRYWISTGIIEPEFHLRDKKRGGRPCRSMDSVSAIEGQDLAGTWRWVKAEKSEVHNPDGLLVTLELASDARPITVKVHTLLYGGPVMVRWLEVTNTGKKPTAITAVSPWSGLVWDTTTYQERLPKGSEAPFEVGYAQYEEWGHEGAWRFEPVVERYQNHFRHTRKIRMGTPHVLRPQQSNGRMVCKLARLER